MDYFTFTLAPLSLLPRMKNTQIRQNCWRPTAALEKVNEDGKEERQDLRGREGAADWVQGFSSVHTRVRSQCTAYSQICAYPTAISFHTKWPSATVFIRCTLWHIHPSCAACSLDCSFKQTNRQSQLPPPRRKVGAPRWSQVTGAFLVFQNIPLMPWMCLCCVDNFPGLSLRRLFWRANH